MKRFIQLFLICIVIISVYFFNNKYLSEDKKLISDLNEPSNQQIQNTDNNIIKNLKYEVNIDKNNLYIITSDLSELTYVNDFEFVNMRGVVAKVMDKDDFLLTIKSDQALYDNSNYNTKFRKNVQIEYMNSKIFSDNIDVNFQDNTVKIFGNVKYDGMNGTINSDNIKIDLITKKVDIYMDDDRDKVQISKN